jgi:phosphoribosyl 1,2-cyclic phosphodiesterase
MDLFDAERTGAAGEPQDPVQVLPVLHHEGTVVATLASGSRGNCTYVGNERRGVLVDCGVSTRQVLLRLAAIGLGEARIDAVLLTHEHADHVGAARVLDLRLEQRQGAPVPFFASRGTTVGLDARCRPRALVEARAGQVFRVGNFTVEPYTVPHDTRDPLSYLVGTAAGTNVGVITDLGRSTHLVERQLARMDVVVLEFNHDVEMLLDGSYPWSLKQRVKGPHGHLSNEQAAEMLRAAASDRLRHVVLAHLSEENNTPDRAVEVAEGALRDLLGRGVGREGVLVHVAAQDRPLDPIRVTAPAPALRTRRLPPPFRPRPRSSLPGAAAGAGQLGLFG